MAVVVVAAAAVAVGIAFGSVVADADIVIGFVVAVVVMMNDAELGPAGRIYIGCCPTSMRNDVGAAVAAAAVAAAFEVVGVEMCVNSARPKLVASDLPRMISFATVAQLAVVVATVAEPTDTAVAAAAQLAGCIASFLPYSTTSAKKKLHHLPMDSVRHIPVAVAVVGVAVVGLLVVMVVAGAGIAGGDAAVVAVVAHCIPDLN